jgi:3-isopropylmalate/(R)-2-methylmalate dehydratase small subunit
LKTIKRTGLGKSLFYEMRYHENGRVKDEFILNKKPYKDSSILIAGKNFGCGSSREHAPWALLDFGIKCIISTSFADIFYNNCFKNGMLPICLDQEKIDELIQYSERKEIIEINLTEQQIMFGNKIIKFDIDPFKKKCLLNGLDDIALSLEKLEKINSYENKIKKNKPWVN